MMRITLNLILLFSILFACKKSDPLEQVPQVSVDFTIYTTDPLYSSLTTNGGHIYYSAGSRGIIIYRRSNDEFKAYDRHCTYKVNDACGQVKVESSGISAADSCCGSGFTLTDGTVIKGPATLPLKQYKTVLDGNKLRVSNF
jgi:nitrite reductase/ring-hydroxylating ferredoxin subunit